MTMMEAIVAIAMVLVLATVGWSSVQGAIELGDALALDDETSRAARVALGRLRRDLQVAYLTEHVMAANTYRTEFVGADRDPDMLWFTTFNNQRLYRDSRESDQAEVTVWVDRAPRDRRPGGVLLYRVAPRVDQFPDEGGRVLPLAYHVDTFDLHYMDGRIGEWTDRWDSRNADHFRRLPRAVRIGLVLLSPDPMDPERRSVDKPFMTTVILDKADPIQGLGMPATDPAMNQGVPPGGAPGAGMGPPGGPAGMNQGMAPGGMRR